MFFNIITLIKIFQFNDKTYPVTVEHIISSFDLVFLLISYPHLI